MDEVRWSVCEEVGGGASVSDYGLAKLEHDGRVVSESTTFERFQVGM